jgi:hypothetical protein
MSMAALSDPAPPFGGPLHDDQVGEKYLEDVEQGAG